MLKQQNPYSNHDIHVPFENGGDVTSLEHDVPVFHRNKMADVEEGLWFSVSFDFVNVIFKKCLSELESKCKNRDQPCFVSVIKHLLDHSEGV